MRTVKVNGRIHVVLAEPNTPLLYVLRNELGLKGARFGCGAGICGACTVQIDGRAVTSCDTPLWAALHGEITTIEGIGSADSPHPIQQAFIDHQAGQCGYCVGGIVMRCKAELEAGADPTDDRILEMLDRHLCRCGAHARILRAVRQVIGSERAKSASPADSGDAQ